MPRPPKARAAILAAARRIVATRGAGHLTFESLSEESGVTRGGITYHFPSKESLLKGLVEDDLVQWDAVSAAHAASAGIACPKTARLLGQLRCSLEDDEQETRFVSGMLSAAMVDPGLLDPVRTHIAREFADWTWDDQDLERYLLLLAADGLFWQRVFALNPLPEAVRARLTALIEAKVHALARTEPTPPFAPDET